MDRRLIKILIVIWSGIAAVSVCFLIYGLTNNINFEGISRVKNKVEDRANMIRKDENISLKNCNRINLNFSRADIIVHTADGSNLRVVERSSSKLEDGEKFIIDRQENDITIKENSGKISYGIFHFRNFDGKIDLYIPKNYTRDLNIHTTSGNISVENLNSRHYNIQTTSGNIYVNSLSGSGQVKVISGNVKINYANIVEYSNVSSISGNVDLNIPEKLSFEFYGRCTSGHISSAFPLNYKNEKRNKAEARIGSEPYKRIDASTISGNINIYN